MRRWVFSIQLGLNLIFSVPSEKIRGAGPCPKRRRYGAQGGRQNLVATTFWLPLSSITNAPAPRVGHIALWTGTGMAIWGGPT